jgi:hypothetical protein
VLDAVAEAWAVGPGRPLSRGVLFESGVTSSHIERITGLARELEWDEKRLVEATQAHKNPRVRGFRTETLETMRDKPTESGYFPTEEPLQRAEALTRVQATMSELVGQGPIDAEEARKPVRQAAEDVLKMRRS